MADTEIEQQFREHAFLDINNAFRYFVELWIKKEGVRYFHASPMNESRYRLITYDLDKKAFFKFVREPYFKCKGGYGDSINADTYTFLVSLFNQKKLDYIYVCYANGHIYRTKVTSFAQYGYKEIDEHEEKLKFYLSLNAKDEEDEPLWERYGCKT